MSREKTAIKTTYFSIISNALLATIKWTAGYFGNSYALIADAIESTTDIFSSALVLVGIKYSSKPADKNHPYGHGRIEPLVTFAVVGFLVISASIIARQSIINIQTPHDLPRAYTLIILAGIIIWKEISYRLVLKKSIFLGKGFESADDWAALFAAAFILYNCYLIFRPALGEVMDEHTHDDVVIKIREVSKTVIGVIETEKCYIRKTGMKYHVDLHIIVDSNITVKEGHDISHQLKNKIQEEMPEISNILMHVEPNS